MGEESGFPIYAKLGFRPSEHSEIDLFAGVVAGGEVRLETSGGTKVFDRDFDPAATIGLRGMILF